MATTATGIANLALNRIGAKNIVSITAGESREAILCNALYAEVLDELLIGEDWGFARHVFDLDETDDVVESDEYSYIYDKPSGEGVPVPLMFRYSSVKLLDDETDDVDWQIMGEYIYSNTEDLRIVATVREDDVTHMPVYFQSALASALAMRLIIPLIADAKRYQILSTILSRDIAVAVLRNQEEGPDRNNSSAKRWDGDR